MKTHLDRPRFADLPQCLPAFRCWDTLDNRDGERLELVVPGEGFEELVPGELVDEGDGTQFEDSGVHAGPRESVSRRIWREGAQNAPEAHV